MSKYPTSLDDLTTKPSDAAEAEKWGRAVPRREAQAGSLGQRVPVRRPGKHNTDSFDVWSNGPDGQSGTDDDIGNWDKT